MRTYGANKSTEFTKKQINVIYGMAKRGELKVEQFIIRELYNLADYYGYDDNRSVERQERKVLEILKNVFDGNKTTAQRLINQFTESTFSMLSRKGQEQADRSYL